MKIFPAIRIEGGLFAPDLLDQLLAEELPGQKPRDFGLDDRPQHDGRDRFRLRRSTPLLASFPAQARAPLRKRLGHLGDPRPLGGPPSDPSRARASVQPKSTHRGRPHLCRLPPVGRGRRRPAGTHRRHTARARTLSPREAPGSHPHALVQEYLNRTESLWGLVTNGGSSGSCATVPTSGGSATSSSTSRPFSSSGFSRTSRPSTGSSTAAAFPVPARMPRSVFSKSTHQRSLEQGERVRDRLRDGVEECLVAPCQRLSRPPEKPEAPLAPRTSAPRPRAHLRRGPLRGAFAARLPLSLSPRVRGPGAREPEPSLPRALRLGPRSGGSSTIPPPSRTTTTSGFRCESSGEFSRRGHAGGEPLASLVGLPVLDGQLFKGISLDDCFLANRDLLAALWHLLNYRESPRARRGA
ncbi:MAG: hypothetical protein KatS3mg082_3285 [Nitrospiraceae bacterium]|nr:MAG: hypothetical protein KatS3mg082_3285 [Nitrospiraceae bacterium]